MIDGDTIDITINLGFDLSIKQRVRVAGVDTQRTVDHEIEKPLGIDATNWLTQKLDYALDNNQGLMIRTELGSGASGKYGRMLGWLYVGEETVSLNEQMIEDGYAWAYDGGSKNKNFQELIDIRKRKRYLSTMIFGFVKKLIKYYIDKIINWLRIKDLT